MANLVHHATHTLAGCKKLVLTSVVVTDIEGETTLNSPVGYAKRLSSKATASEEANRTQCGTLSL